MSDPVVEAMRNSLAVEAECLARLTDTVSLPAMAQAVVQLTGCRLVTTTASGSSGMAAAKFAHSLCCVERPAKFLSPAEAIHGGLGCVQSDGVLVAISRGGGTAELLPVVEIARERGAFVIVVTENDRSPLAALASLILPLRVQVESDPLGVMATSSFVATVAVLDAVLAGVIARSGFTTDRFAQIHPGGAVGAALTSAGARPDDRAGSAVQTHETKGEPA